MEKQTTYRCGKCQNKLNNETDAEVCCLKVLNNVEDLQQFSETFLKNKKGVHSWHEPDNCGVSGHIVGNHLDNAGCGAEFQLILSVDDEEHAVINIADLLETSCNNDY